MKYAVPEFDPGFALMSRADVIPEPTTLLQVAEDLQPVVLQQEPPAANRWRAGANFVVAAANIEVARRINNASIETDNAARTAFLLGTPNFAVGMTAAMTGLYYAGKNTALREGVTASHAFFYAPPMNPEDTAVYTHAFRRKLVGGALIGATFYGEGAVSHATTGNVTLAAIIGFTAAALLPAIRFTKAASDTMSGLKTKWRNKPFAPGEI